MELLEKNDEVENSKDNVEAMEDEINNVETKCYDSEHQVNDPEVGMLFANVDEMFEYYRNYGKQKGFAVIRRTCKKGKDGAMKYVTFVCARSGTSKCTSSNVFRPHRKQSTDCKARIMGSLDSNERWRLNSLILDHNHGLSPTCNREISSHVNDKAGIIPNKSYNSFVVEEAGGHDNVSFLEKDNRNPIEKVGRLRLGEGDAKAIQAYFMKMQSQNAGFYFSMNFDEEGRLRNVFWADSRSRAAYKEFGDVITFDTTYLTNKYDMPLASFLGVNHHGQSTLFGCGLISSEDTESFTWLFQTWLACMSDCAPNGIITDQDRAMTKAIETVFPNSRHQWCLWHIMKKFPEKLGDQKPYKSISFALCEAVYDSQSPAEFEENWSVIVEKYTLHCNEWLSGLFNERRRWLPCFLKNSFWAGMSTTQRNEGINPFFDGYVNSKTTLKQFVEQYDNVVRNKVEKETAANYNSFFRQILCVTAYDMERQVQGAYTISKFKEFQNELVGKLYCEFISMREDCIVSEYDIREDVMIGERKKRLVFKVSLQKDDCEVTCSCLMFEFRGIICRHALAVLIRNDILLLPEKYIMRRWRKGIKRCHTRVKIDSDGWSVTTEQRRYDKMCTAFTKVADLAADDEESYIGMMDLIENAMNELSFKKTTCGRNQANPTSLVHKVSSNKINNTTNDSQNKLERKQSTACKKQRKKKLDLKDSQTTGPSPYQLTNVIPAQETIVMADPQYQCWNDPYGMQVMPKYGFEVMVELPANANQVQGDGTPPRHDTLRD